MRSRFPRNSGRFILAVVIFGAVLGIRLGPWPLDEPVVDDPPEFVVPVPQLRFRDPAALEAAVPNQRRADRTRTVHHPAARHIAPRTPHLGPSPPRPLAPLAPSHQGSTSPITPR